MTFWLAWLCRRISRAIAIGFVVHIDLQHRRVFQDLFLLGVRPFHSIPPVTSVNNGSVSCRTGDAVIDR